MAGWVQMQTSYPLSLTVFGTWGRFNGYIPAIGLVIGTVMGPASRWLASRHPDATR
ncbi:MAG: hypothetical protein AAF311_09110 [Pseudomonadota bacterium]